MAERRWRVRLSAAAELDFANILKWTTENFGARQSRVYQDTLVQAIGELADGPNVSGSKARDEIMPGLRTVHVARQGRRGSHFLMYRVTPKNNDRNRADTARQNGPSASPSIFSRREGRIKRPAAGNGDRLGLRPRRVHRPLVLGPRYKSGPGKRDESDLGPQ
jgi:toxin ParE1/3/4